MPAIFPFVTSAGGYPIQYVSTDPRNIIFAAQTINGAWAKASTAANAFDDITANTVNKIDALAAASELTVDSANETPVTEPSITIPTDVTPGNIMSLFDTKYLELVALLTDKFTAFQSTYFPNDGAIYSQAETWLNDALSNPDQAIPAAVAAQLLTDTKSQAYTAAVVETDAVMATFAARRFPLPSGAAASAVLQINQKAQESIADAGRKLMMGYVDQLRFAVEKTMAMRQESMSSAVAYITALASGPDMASRAVSIGYDAQSKMVSAAASFYQARIEASRLLKSAEQFNVDAKYRKDDKNVANDITLLQEDVRLLLTEAQALAQIATSLFNNLHASTSVTASA